jgi:hypothetical protein
MVPRQSPAEGATRLEHFQFGGFILRDGASRLLRMRSQTLMGEERGNAAGLRPSW